MLICLLTDTHFGVRANNKHFHNNNRKFYSNVFFPTLASRGITRIIHLGDVFDERVKVDVHTIKQAREYFFEPLVAAGIKMDIIPGNHDLYWRERSDTSSLEEIVEQFDGISVISDPCVKIISNRRPYLYIPWINNQNRAQIFSFISKYSDMIAFGHLQLMGYHMYRGQIAMHGDDPAVLKGFKHVYTGHFHHKNTEGNITYLGSNQQHTWADAGDRRGFHILDTETEEIEFIENPYDMFTYVDYIDGVSKGDDLNVEGMYIRVRPDSVTKQSHLDAFTKVLTARGALEVKVMQSKISAETPEILEDEDLGEVNDTVQIIRNSVEDIPVRSKMIDLYEKALAVT